MIKTVKALLFASLAGLLTACSEPENTGPLPANTDGKIYFINYWAEWCKPCREELPALSEFGRANSDRARVFGVNFDGVKDEALDRLETALGVDFPTLAEDPAPFLGVATPAVLPTTLVLDQQGKVVRQLEGEQTIDSLERILSELLAMEESPE